MRLHGGLTRLKRNPEFLFCLCGDRFDVQCPESECCHVSLALGTKVRLCRIYVLKRGQDLLTVPSCCSLCRLNVNRIRYYFSDMYSVYLDAGTWLPISQGVFILSFLTKLDRPLSKEHIWSWKTIGKLVRGWLQTEGKKILERISPTFDTSK